MFSAIVLIAAGYVALSAAAWVMSLVFRVLGWSFRMLFSVLLLPFWIVIAIVGGLATAFQALLPIVVIAFLIGIFLPES